MDSKELNELSVLYGSVISFPNSEETELLNRVFNLKIAPECSNCRYIKDNRCGLRDVPLRSCPKVCRKNRTIYEFNVYDKTGKKIGQCEQNDTDVVNSFQICTRPSDCIEIKGNVWIRCKTEVKLL